MITSFYAAVLGLLFFILSINVIRLRTKHKIGFLDHTNEEFERAYRSHGNYSEYVPFILILMLLAELQNSMPSNAFHFCGIILILGRFLHIYSLLFHEPKTKRAGRTSFRFRQIGMVMTFTTMLILSAYHLIFWYKVVI